MIGGGRRDRPVGGFRCAPSAADRLALGALWALTMLTDAVPPRYRFGRWNQLWGVLAFPEPMQRVPPPVPDPPHFDAGAPGGAVSRRGAPGRRGPTCAIIAGDLDTGGVESVVAALAHGLQDSGFVVEIVCSAGGRVAQELLASGVRVSIIATAHLARHLRDRLPDVIQLHRPDPALIAELEPFAERTVPVFHALEAYLSAAAWRRLAAFASRAPLCVAVSGSVRDYFAVRMPNARIRVVVNGVAPARLPAQGRAAARSRVDVAIGGVLDESDILVLALQRFSDQKNAAGLVDAFLLAAEREARVRLVVAGAPNSWLEVRRADILRRVHPRGDRVHLLDDSHTPTLLQAADVFALDSFSEGGPLAAVEAAAFGLPVVCSDVGFAAELVRVTAPGAVLVARANRSPAAASLARQRRKRHQSNRAVFAHALLQMAMASRRPPATPEGFSLDDMVDGHAAVLRVAMGVGSGRL